MGVAEKKTTTKPKPNKTNKFNFRWKGLAKKEGTKKKGKAKKKEEPKTNQFLLTGEYETQNEDNALDYLQSNQPASLPVEKEQQTSQDTKKSGVIYLGHIPHGFFETQMEIFF